MVAIPNGVTVSVTGNKITVKGPKGTVEREFKEKGLSIKVEGKEIVVSNVGKLPKATLGSIQAHVQNMVIGAEKGYEKKMQVLYAHFPVTLEIKGKTFFIKNFIGEKKPREAEIIGDTKIAVKGADVSITGPNKEHVGQTVSNIRTAVKIRNRDPRIFQDGLYVVE